MTVTPSTTSAASAAATYSAASAAAAGGPASSASSPTIAAGIGGPACALFLTTITPEAQAAEFLAQVKKYHEATSKIISALVTTSDSRLREGLFCDLWRIIWSQNEAGIATCAISLPRALEGPLDAHLSCQTTALVSRIIQTISINIVFF